MSGINLAPGEVSIPRIVAAIRQLVGLAPRTRLNANRTYYVRADGSDANDGSTNAAAGAFLTVQKAINLILSSLDLAGFDVAIQLADGTYTGRITLATPQVGSGNITIQGNNATPSNVIISTTASSGTAFLEAAFKAQNGARLTVKDLKIQTTTNGSCLFAETNAVIGFSNLVFGASARSHIESITGAVIQFQGNYTISGGAAISHYFAIYTGVIDTNLPASPYTVTLSGTPAFVLAFAYASDGILDMYGTIFSGAATGPRFICTNNAFMAVYSGGVNYFPGNAAGTISFGGVYDTSPSVPYFIANLSANQGSLTGPTKVNYDTEIADSNGWYDNATNYRFLPLLAGKYLVTHQLEGSATAVTTCAAYIYKNGANYARSLHVMAAGSVFQFDGVTVTAIINFNGSTDYVEAFAIVSGTGTPVADGGTGPITSWFQAQFISP